MAVAVRAATPAMDGNTSQPGLFTWDVPAASQAGDIALLFSDSNTAAATAPTPSGWTLLDGPKYLTANMGGYLWGKVLAAGDLSTTVSTTWTNGGKLHGGGIVLSGAVGLPTGAAIQYWSDGTDGTTVQAGNVTTPDANDLVVALGAFRAGVIGLMGLMTADAAYTVDARGRTNHSATPNFEAVIAHHTALVPASGTLVTGPLFTFAGSDTGRGQGWTVAISPASAPVPNAAFTATPGSGQSPLTVAFTDASTGTPTGWAWDFGDGTTSNAQNPTHVYTVPGTYTVTLSVSNSAGADPTPATATITVLGNSGYKFYKLRGGVYVPASILPLRNGVYG